MTLKEGDRVSLVLSVTPLVEQYFIFHKGDPSKAGRPASSSSPISLPSPSPFCKPQSNSERTSGTIKSLGKILGLSDKSYVGREHLGFQDPFGDSHTAAEGPSNPQERLQQYLGFLFPGNMSQGIQGPLCFGEEDWAAASLETLGTGCDSSNSRHGSRTGCLPCWVFEADGDFLWMNGLDPDVVREVYICAGFTLPGYVPRPLCAVINPARRYCIDLLHEPRIRWDRNRAFRKHAGDFAVTVNLQFETSLRALQRYHLASETGGSTWLTDELLALLVKFWQENDASPVKHCVFEFWERRRSNSCSGAACDGHKRESPLAGQDCAAADSAAPTLAAPSADNPGCAALRSARRKRARLCPGAGIAFEGLSCPESSPGGAERGGDGGYELVAVCAGFAVGRAYHDYSMATLRKDKRGIGHIASKAVGHILQRCGYEIWYWGSKYGYMADYDSYGGREFERQEFKRRWLGAVHRGSPEPVLVSAALPEPSVAQEQGPREAPRDGDSGCALGMPVGSEGSQAEPLDVTSALKAGLGLVKWREDLL